MSANLTVLLLNLAGFSALSLAMPKHARQLLPRALSKAARTLLRAIGWLLLAAAIAIAVHYWRLGIGMVVWVGWLSVAGLSLAFTLPRFARESAPQDATQRQSHGRCNPDLPDGKTVHPT